MTKKMHESEAKNVRLCPVALLSFLFKHVTFYHDLFLGFFRWIRPCAKNVFSLKSRFTKIVVTKFPLPSYYKEYIAFISLMQRKKEEEK